MHGACGAWGLIAAGLFATQDGVQAAYGTCGGYGLFYGGGGTQFGIQLLGLVCIAAWSASLAGALFLALRKIGWLRVSKEEESQGLDYTQARSAPDCLALLGCTTARLVLARLPARRHCPSSSSPLPILVPSPLLQSIGAGFAFWSSPKSVPDGESLSRSSSAL